MSFLTFSQPGVPGPGLAHDALRQDERQRDAEKRQRRLLPVRRSARLHRGRVLA